MITETFTMSMFLDMVNSIRIWIFFVCVCGIYSSAFLLGKHRKQWQQLEKNQKLVCIRQEVAKIICIALKKMFFETWRYAKFVLQFQTVSALLQKVEFRLVCQGGCKGNRLEYWLFDAELQARNVETACMQSSVFKAGVKAKVIALPAQEWIKSEIPALTSSGPAGLVLGSESIGYFLC